MTTHPRGTLHAAMISFATLAIVSGAVRFADAAEPAGSPQERMAKVKADLKSEDSAIRLSAISSLVHSDISPKLLSEMQGALADRDGAVRSTAATAIGNLGVAAVPAIPQLITQLKSDPVKEARETAARALGRIGKAAPEEKQIVAPLVTAGREDADPVTRIVAHGALAMIDVEVTGQISSLRKHLHHEEPLVRMKAAHALGMIGTPAQAAAPEIVRVLERETDSHRRGYVARALGNTGDPASLPALHAALEKETDPGAQGEIRGAISRLGGKVPESVKMLLLPGESFLVAGRPAFILLPEPAKRHRPQPWILYAPTLPGYPDQHEKWMHEQFLAAGVAVAGIDVGEAYGSPKGRELFAAFYKELVEKRGYAAKPCLLGRSRGGLWVTSWACEHPDQVAGLAGIYPVFDLRTYPGIAKAAPAYGLTPQELEARLAGHNPIERVGTLARAKVPAFFIHGDEDKVVPLRENSAEFVARYQAAGAEDSVTLLVAKGQGHNFWEGFFRCQELIDFAIARARDGGKP